MLLKGCLNGTRSKDNHPRCPISSGELARDAAEVVAAGVVALHVHPRNDDGDETLAASHLSSSLSAIRDRVAVPVGVSTGAWFLPDPADRLRAIEQWEILPDFASVNFHEAGAIDVARLLLDRGVGVEAGLWNEEAAAVLVDADLGQHCLRLLFEPMEQSIEAALANVAAMESVTRDVPRGVPRLLHGYERTTWPLLQEAARRSYQGRIGFEDTLVRPTGERAPSNAALVSAALEVVRATGTQRALDDE